MNAFHPNVLELLAINIDPQSGALSTVSEFMENGNIVDYIRVNEANRIQLVRHFGLWPFCGLTATKLGDVARGLSYLHKHGTVHGGLKGVSEITTFAPPLVRARAVANPILSCLRATS